VIVFNSIFQSIKAEMESIGGLTDEGLPCCGQPLVAPELPASTEMLATLIDAVQSNMEAESVTKAVTSQVKVDAAAAQVRGSVRRLTFEPEDCRIVQSALEHAGQKDAAELATELRGCVWKAVNSPHGNYVVQKIIEVLPPALAAFIGEELQGFGSAASRHRFGCRIMCRLLEHFPAEPATVFLIEEALQEAGDLCSHTFGHHVIESVLVHGLPKHRDRIASACVHKLQNGVCERPLLYLLQSALQHCSSQHHADFAMALLSNPTNFFSVVEDKVGRHVVKALLLLAGDSAQAARSFLDGEVQHRLNMTAHGKELLAALHFAGFRAQA
jgi:hypothetical protein